MGTPGGFLFSVFFFFSCACRQPSYVGYVAVPAGCCTTNTFAMLAMRACLFLPGYRNAICYGGFVACADDFTDQPEVINGASDLMVEVFGEAGRHARFAVGSNTLPRGTCVEVEGTFLIE